ncbi:regulatory protein GemA [Shewanella sp. NKUCC01_JLK]|uniref:gp16 family protein n=1 Tax=Shewanella sp. NKUCC01_JLK TaxID=2842123 RepID=UPI001C5AB509|nr:regulatory protein GemA [Shewanella sp. NKUCC01_JLK]MBW3513218.1 regulatory protein GemA [Shewanella sp. NKUCC01_JLK]
MLETNQKVPVHANAHPVAHNKKRLITLINVAKGSLQLDEAIYRAMLKNATGKDSLRAMNLPELEKVLEVFKQKGFKPTLNTHKKRRLSPAAGKSKLASIDKIRAIWITMGHHLVIQDNSESALDAYVRRMTLRSRITNNQTQGVDATAWMTEPQAYKVLESLKNWHKRVLIERIIVRGERLKMNEAGTRPANYEVIVAQYEGHGHE